MAPCTRSNLSGTLRRAGVRKHLSFRKGAGGTGLQLGDSNSAGFPPRLAGGEHSRTSGNAVVTPKRPAGISCGFLPTPRLQIIGRRETRRRRRRERRDEALIKSGDGGNYRFGPCSRKWRERSCLFLRVRAPTRHMRLLQDFACFRRNCSFFTLAGVHAIWKRCFVSDGSLCL